MQLERYVRAGERFLNSYLQQILFAVYVGYLWNAGSLNLDPD